MFFSRQLDKEQISQCPLVTTLHGTAISAVGASAKGATVETVDAQLLLILGGIYWLSAGALRTAVDQREPPAGAAAQRVWLSVAVLGHL